MGSLTEEGLEFGLRINTAWWSSTDTFDKKDQKVFPLKVSILISHWIWKIRVVLVGQAQMNDG